MNAPAGGRLRLDSPVQFLKGAGPKRAPLLARLGIDRVEDLLYHIPYDYLMHGGLVPLGQIHEGIRCTTRGQVLDLQSRRIRGGRVLVSGVIGDGAARLVLSWFNAPWVPKQVKVGDELVLSGEPTRYRGRLQMVNPAFESGESEGGLSEGRPVPRYALTAGIAQAGLRGLVRRALDATGEQLVDPMPEAWREAEALLPLRAALEAVHRPANLEEAAEGRRRLAFDEALALQLAVGVRRRQLLRRASTVRVERLGELSRRYVEGLGFELTGAQRRVLKEIREDLSSQWAMHRLLQGDVGSGKTLVALVAMIWAAEAGGQAAFMAPTEILARQHASRNLPALEDLGLRGAVLTGSTPSAERRAILRGLRDGSIAVIFGTHALIQADVEFARLGLAVVDEQHRFGVVQRAVLSGGGAHLLVMSATPIPRSLALTVFADLDLSILDEKPPGRIPVLTHLVPEDRLDDLYPRLRRRIEQGARAYLVFPLVEESEGGDLASATVSFEELSAGPLEGLRLGLLHGRMTPREKERVRVAFTEGEIQVLVTTTVIEVGVDVPEATTMIIYHAERFGLAQLHQLRGRVGRGSGESVCVLVASEGLGPQGRRRLELVASTEDGFALAEEDLKTRGMGDLQGLRQHGEMPLKLLNPLSDGALVDAARSYAESVLQEDPLLRTREHRPLAQWLDHLGSRNPFWSSTG